MKKKLLALFLSLVMLTTEFLQIGNAAKLSDSLVTILLDGEPVSSVSIPENEERLLIGKISEIDAESYNWQIKIKDTDIWVNIDGCDVPECSVSFALVGSMLDKNDRAYLRLEVTASDGIYTSDPVTVKITEPVENIVAEPVEISDEEQDNMVEVYVNTPTTDTGDEPVEIPEETEPDESLEEMIENATEADAEPKEAFDKAPAEAEEVLEEVSEELEYEQEEVFDEIIEELPEDTLEEIPAEEPEEAPKGAAKEMIEAVPETMASLMSAFMPMTAYAADSGDDVIAPPSSIKTYEVTVEFLYQNGTSVTQPYMANVAEGSPLDTDIKITPLKGYEAYFDENGDGSYTDDEKIGIQADGNYLFDINLAGVDRSYRYIIRFIPVEVSYTVEHYIQNRDDDGYTKSLTENKTGLTNSLVPADLTLTDGIAEGHTAQTYEQTTIAADGSTVVRIYYLVNYYLIDFELGDDAFGVVPVYVRYNTTVTVPTPTRLGWSFLGWELVEYADNTATEDQKTEHYLNINGSITVPDANLKYQALWQEDKTYYTVVYWREAESKCGDTGDIKYEYWDTQIVGATLTEGGDIILDNSVNANDKIVLSDYYEIPDNIATNADGVNERGFFHCNEAKTEEVNNGTTVTVSGDSSTVINIYFDRNEYTLKFYYAAKDGNNNYIFGRTNPFGAEASSRTNRNDEVALFDAAWSTSSYSFIKATVDSIPEIINDDNKYTLGTDRSKTSNNRTYYYFTFKAKYGADISEYWPTAEDISTVSTTSSRLGDAVFSAWNGEYNVYYTQHKSDFGNNETIKGQYDRLDYRVLWDTSLSAASNPSTYNNTVTYLSYWNNVTNQEWNIPALYRYNIYLECLTQHTAETTCELCSGKSPKTFTVNGVTKTYYRTMVYDVADNSETGNLQEQTYPDVYGFSNVNDGNGTNLTQNAEYITLGSADYNTAVYRNGYEIYWFYDRNRYDLEFWNEGKKLRLRDADGNFMDRQTIRYGVSLFSPGGYDISGLTDEDGESYYPDTLPENAYRFEGWYTSPTFASGTVFNFDEHSTMPASNLALYAHWVPIKFKVQIYYNRTEMEKNNPLWTTTEADGTVRDYTLIDYGAHAPTPSEQYEQSTNEALHFVGWFYLDGETEKAWSFDNMVVTRDMKIYAKWTSGIVRSYTIYYRLEDGTEIAAPSEGTEMVGNTITLLPKTGTQLYEGYQENYFPITDGDSHKYTLTIGDNIENTGTIYYKKATSVPYKVKYVDEYGNELLATKEITENPYSIVTEVFEKYDGYMPDAYSKRLVVGFRDDGSPDTENNVITFVYTKIKEGETPKTYYRYEHYVQAEEGYGYELYDYADKVGDIGSPVSVDILNRTGFTYNTSKTAVTSDGSELAYNSDSNKVSATLPAEGLLFRLYYDRKELNYTVRYLKDGTDEELKPSETKTVLYGRSITEKGIEIKGYELITSAITQTVTTDGAELRFYYQETNTGIVYKAKGNGSVSLSSETVPALSGSPKGSTPIAEGGYHFVGWYRDEACRNPVNPAWVEQDTNKLIPQAEDGYFAERTYYALFERNTADLTISTDFPSGNNYRPVDGSQTFVFRITGTGSNSGISLTITLHERESKTIADLPTGTYIVTELTSSAWRYSADNGTKNVEVRPNQTNSISFLERRNQPYWLDGNATKAVNVFDPLKKSGDTDEDTAEDISVTAFYEKKKKEEEGEDI